MLLAAAGTALGLVVILLETANRVFGTYLRTPARVFRRVAGLAAVVLLYALPLGIWWLEPGNTVARALSWLTAVLGVVLLVVYLRPPRFGVRRAKGAEELRRPLAEDAELRTVRLAPPAWPADAPALRILALSDPHCNTLEEVERVSARARAACAEPPDLVLVPGDLGETEALLPEVLRMLGDLPSRHGTFLVLGNHDMEEGRDEVIPELAAEAGVHLLRNQVLPLPQAGVAVAGLEVPWQGAAPAPETDLPLLGLVHSPDAVFDLARINVRAAVCGHTHGGMFRPPVIGPLLVPSLLGRALAYGVYRLGSTHLVVSSGACAPLPHTSEKPEVVLLELG